MPNIHPLLIHFPVALLTAAWGAELAAMLLKREELSLVGWWTQVAGTVGLAAAAVTGLLAADALRVPPGAVPLLDAHREYAFLSSGLFALLLFWRIGARGKRPPGRDLFYLLVFTAGLASLWAGAWYGGEMVYRFGAGVQAAPPG